MLVTTLLLVATLATAEDLPPSCTKRVFCNSKLLHHVQMSRIFPDSKTFVDRHLLNDEETTLSAFQELLDQTNDKPTEKQIREFVNKYFDESSELESWTPPDFNSNPQFLSSIRDGELRQFAKDINDIWPTLGRKVKQSVIENPDQYSFLPVTHGFVIPGGRFTELYYWDTYWIIEGLLVSGMKETVKGVLENLIELVNKLGHIPNGSRCYYQQRSQPPLLTSMVSLYIHATNDTEFLKNNIQSLEAELNYWLDTQIYTFDIGDKAYTLLRYYAASEGPRPESYQEDYTNAQIFDNDKRKTQFYIDIKSAAESGWDFSTRWFIKNGTDKGNLTDIHATELIPVDLNSIFAKALKNMAYFHALINNYRIASHWSHLAKQWTNNIEKVLWDVEDGCWHDWDLVNKKFRKYFYPINIAPLWMGIADKEFVVENAPRILKYLKESHGLDYPGGIPTSLVKSGEQWDFPNAWPPLVSLAVNAIEALELPEAKDLAFRVAQSWVRSCYKGFSDNKQMFEKYDVEVPGRIGGGGEYTVQTGFGWSNGVVLEFIAKYGQRMSLYDMRTESSDLLSPREDGVLDASSEDSSKSDSSDTEEVIMMTFKQL
ncbi:trehalase-like isoform X1 [Pieris brassicae]|nr:trehalase-like isoform X1 [Pieris brassicae]XP_045521592.1 trehalase-like isoform X1 [Pieris brassicae]